ncbi:uncharacterized protein N7484_006233 [Penicillium longicatenatum]|uniref:uncharacterized protein n=1 Tax=Penicillium longicatenatum TaxID=1561947 RepID=UPI0025497D01|nr:uncharacterized protein N7484_006233 [Penicillium longicatenatum]KAJ5643726.1 hypothetical protein N7484_006233 [Penicillium longicatenatum]
MARSTAEEMDRLQLSDEDTEDLWDSPSKRGTHKTFNPRTSNEIPAPEPRQPRDGGDTLFDRQEAREAALHNELQTVRKINEVIEGLLGSIDRAKGNMDTVSRTVTSASTLLNTWTRILSQTEHNQRLILNRNWHGATQDVADMETEEAQKRQAAERREQALQQQREAAARKAEEEAQRRALSTRGTRGTSRGTVRSTGLGRTPSSNRSHAGIFNNNSTTNQWNCARSPPHHSNTMNFAPYEDESPEIERALSPPHPDTRIKSPNLRSPRASADLPSPSQFAGGGHGNTGFGRDLEGGHVSLGAFETSLPIRMDVEAALAYLLLPPAGGVFLLLAEHKSDYVRFHAWQSSMLFTVLFIVHLLLSWSSFLSWTLFIIDLALMGFLSMRAYRDVDTLDHFEVPYFGRLANSFVDDE